MFRTQGGQACLIARCSGAQTFGGPRRKGTNLARPGPPGPVVGRGVASLALPSNELTTPLIDSWPDPNSCHPLLTFGWAFSKLTIVRDTVDTCPVYLATFMHMVVRFVSCLWFISYIYTFWKGRPLHGPASLFQYVQPKFKEYPPCPSLSTTPFPGPEQFPLSRRWGQAGQCSWSGWWCRSS